MFAQPLIIRACSASSILIVPGWPVPIPIVVALLWGKIEIFPDPPKLALITGFESVVIVRLLAAMVCAPLNVMTPVKVWYDTGSAHVKVPTLMGAVWSTRPITIFPHVLSELVTSVLFKDKVPACPVPTPMDVAAVSP